MTEYEYSFKVKDVEPFIEYCKNNGYKKIDETSQIRELYKNVNKIRARITTNQTGSETKTVLDFKEDIQSNDVLNVSKETLPLTVTEENKEAINSILEMLDYKKDNVLIRNRIVYKKDNVTFEIDNYTSPEIMGVIAIEGEKEAVDKVYEEVNETIKS